MTSPTNIDPREIIAQFEKLDQKLDRLDQKQDQKLDKLDQKLDLKLNQLDQKLDLKLDKLDQKLEEKLDKIVGRIETLEVGQARIESRLEAWNPQINKVSDLAEKVGELKNWRQIALIIITVIISGGFGWFLRSGKL